MSTPDRRPGPPCPLARLTSTLAPHDTDGDAMTLDVIITHGGGGTPPESAAPTSWTDLPESGQAGWIHVTAGEFDVHLRVFP
jgi:hypothetical protein